ncbi:hypothetical protein [Deinococcus peraridilitoris]|uniref:HAD superfamily Cof-like phosphohydrolase n=1 Tax=Deinococcus peraridilitoris (strain DSM 19664 / LMG 22246 / CIP 109416 / KR-200) TaxID=937777 RepID=K9ZXZ1_DEIPD|nr:hypothetical protein [Deinococcus peraridilitoris]AFZ66471.1 hypothetical protein Deipe_0902 [Deinococcus peraridilitoris DSM 19664]
MKTNAERVREFHAAVGVLLPTRPTVPGSAQLELRRTLLCEEYGEVMQEFDRLQAAAAPAVADLAPLAQELVDLLYVSYGALEALGVDADAVFAEVHRVNMHKTTGPKRADGKQLKPAGWQPADVRAVIEALASGQPAAIGRQP